MKFWHKWIFLMILAIPSMVCGSVDHPKVILTKKAAKEIKEEYKNYPLMKSSVESVIKNADKALGQKIDVPFPKDAAGGYTHEKHKQNQKDMYEAGLAYQLTGERKYAYFVENILLKYAELYPTLGIHPEQKNQTPGKLFWQGLNETVWMVYSIQAYDCIYETLTKNNRELIENQLFKNMADFFLYHQPTSFDRIHNHGTWAVAAVGMTGIVLGDDSLVQKALYGSKEDKKSGYFKQLDLLFSPDGYYTEGPYYQRYALLPFIIFAQALQQNYPSLNVFKYRDGLLGKIVETLPQCSDTDGDFFPINDATKYKNFLSEELLYGVDIAYYQYGNNQLLSIAKEQKKVMISEAGLAVAKAIAAGKAVPFVRNSIFISDGPDGKMGGLGIMRNGNEKDQIAVVFKFGSHGMDHGHFDRLSLLMYNEGEEIFSDYGAARFVNVEPKYGGRYLPENKSFAQQTIAHNTVTVNQMSHFDGNMKMADEHAPDLLFYDIKKQDFQIFAAVDSNSYEKTVLQRALALIEVEKKPILLDIFNVVSDNINETFDYSLYYQGHLINTSFDYKACSDAKQAWGQMNGYQHLWIDAVSTDFREKDFMSLTFLTSKNFYTISSLLKPSSEVFLTRVGASDPNFNLRNEPGITLRNRNDKQSFFFSIIEPHGNFDGSSESVSNASSSIKNLTMIHSDKDTFIAEGEINNKKVTVMLTFNPDKADQQKTISKGGVTYTWRGWCSYTIK